MSAPLADQPIWSPSPERIASARVTDFRQFIQVRTGLALEDYPALWQWSVKDVGEFWRMAWEYFNVQSPTPIQQVMDQQPMPHTQWFTGATVNFAAHVFSQSRGTQDAILSATEDGEITRLSWLELEQQVSSCAAWLSAQGVVLGDRVAAYLPNCPQAVVAFLATVSIGAIWSVCSPDMGATSVVDRFKQIAPKVLIACDSYQYSGKPFARTSVLEEICAQLPSLEQRVHITQGATLAGFSAWSELINSPQAFKPVWVAFDHPLWIVYSSGTTGTPKAIMHGHGGMILSMSVGMGLHNDLGPNDTFLWYSTTGWIMWNCQIAGLLVGSTICLLDGNPGYPDLGALWRFAGRCGVTLLGAGAAYYGSCVKAGLTREQMGDIQSIRSIGSTGSPLSADAYRWLYDTLDDIWLSPMSGGTDIAGPFIAGVPVLPVYAGEMQCRVLGADIQAFDDQGRALCGDVGELVCTQPMPCMPIGFWNDESGSRYHDSYFDTYPNIWRHGDWISINERGGVVVYGRSDATINRQGIRMGTAELYRAVEALPEVLDSMVVDLEYLERESFMPLFVVLKDGEVLTEALKQQLIAAIRQALTARHVPNQIIQVAQIPRTLTGKKLEVPIKRLLLGHAADAVVNYDAMANPECMGWYLEYAKRYLSQTAVSS